mmetsp:Transcript_40165/g.110620  ORF Transcript_40165/g.110620 Transcript_40165/m.110620 type:complete len:175 (+) Transcript_40165:85-609(+)
MADDDEDDLESLLHAAGFDTPPVDVEGVVERTLDVARLRQHLEEVAGGGKIGGLERERELRAGRSERQSLSSHAHDGSGPFGARELHSELDVLRMYGGGACGTLFVSFSGISPGMGGISCHEFVGTCQRVGASNVLFVRGSRACTTTACWPPPRMLPACRGTRRAGRRPSTRAG